MEYIIALFALTVVVLLLFSVLSFKKSGPADEGPQVYMENREYKPCPICQKGLTRGERVHSTIFKGQDDSIMHIYGCPYCYKSHPAGGRKYSGELRRCPVCKANLPLETMVYARVFEKPGKTHVHVLGCPRCRRNK